MELYVGKPKYFSLHKVYIKHIVKEKVVAKEIVRDGVQLIKVFDAIAEKITKGYTDGTDENKGHIFIRQYNMILGKTMKMEGKTDKHSFWQGSP